MPATPELLAQVDALPPATDTPDVDEAQAARAGAALHAAQAAAALRRAAAASACCWSALDAVAELLLPVLIRHGIDHGVDAAGARRVVLARLLGLALVVLADWVRNRRQTRMTGRTGERVLYTLRVKIFAQLQRLGLDYYERELAGRIMTRMTTDVDALSTFLQTGLVTAVVSRAHLLRHPGRAAGHRPAARRWSSSRRCRC